MKRVILFGLIIIAGVLSWQITSFDLVLIAFIGLAVIFLIPVGVISLFRRPNSGFIRVPLYIIFICFIGVLVSLFRPNNAAILETGDISEKLEYAYNTDQKDRMQLKFYVLGDLKERDKVRLDQVNGIIRQEKQLNPLDKFYAAFIYHHSNNSGDYKRASDLATSAAKAPELQDHYLVQWLNKAAYDRWMISIGKPEKYNTQNNFTIGFE